MMTGSMVGAGGTGDRFPWLMVLGLRPVGWPSNSPFFQYSNIAQICTFKYTILPSSKIIETFHDDLFEHDEQHSLLAQLLIPTGFHVINFGTLSNLKLP
jgi:hypothetical protein